MIKRCIHDCMYICVFMNACTMCTNVLVHQTQVLYNYTGCSNQNLFNKCTVFYQNKLN